MISLLYHSHTVIPAHLGELEAIGLIEADEQILVALDGVLLDSGGLRLSGPTLHDYCLVTSLRVILWARDYGRHLCYAFPLAELTACDGVGIDPLHATLQMTFAAAEGDEDEQQFTLTLLPLANLQAALTLLGSAAETARAMIAQGYAARESGPEIMAVLSELIYGHVDGLRPGEAPYRWPGAAQFAPALPSPSFQQDPASLPPGQIYAAGRLARSAWDTLRRTLKEAELPFDLSSGSLRELTEAVRAVNDLVQTVSSNPAAQQMAMTFLNRNAAAKEPGEAMGAAAAWGRPAATPAPAAPAPRGRPAPEPPATPPQASEYREIPLRRREAAAAASRQAPAAASEATAQRLPAAREAVAPPAPDRRELPLRRRAPAAAMSGSGDAAREEGRPPTDEGDADAQRRQRP